jgi:hypothetical protein
MAFGLLAVFILSSLVLLWVISKLWSGKEGGGPGHRGESTASSVLEKESIR